MKFAKAIKAEVERTLGPDVSVKRAEHSFPLEIDDLDAKTSKEELLEIMRSLGDDDARVISLRKSYGGTQTALIMVPSGVARRLCNEGRIRVGLVYARVRAAELETRCYRCLAFGHMAKNCAGADRSICCWHCRGEGHRSRDCTASPEESAAFIATLKLRVLLQRSNRTVEASVVECNQGAQKEDVTGSKDN